jgi:uncharacterized protein (DUF1684 family)
MTAAIPPEMKRDVDSWRAEKDREMRAPDSPFAYAGRIDLKDGSHLLGSGPDDRLRFTTPGVPEHALALIAQDVRVQLKALVAMVALNGQPVTEAYLKTDDTVDVGPLHLVYQGDRDFMVYNLGRPEALSYRGLHYLPLNAHYRMPATFEPAAAGKTLILETSQHSQKELPLVGVLHFTLDGHSLSLEGFRLGERPNDLFVIFRDATSGTKTYGAGRFLWVKAPVGGKTVIDFNLAWNPLCAYSDAYNCPLAPPENRLAIPIPVGEAPYHE